MKTEELKALGLNDEQVQRVFAMNGADVNREKQAAETAKAERDAMRTQLDEANTKLTGYLAQRCKKCKRFTKIFLK